MTESLSLLYRTVGAGALLVFLLPIGLFYGINTFIFQFVFIAHFALLISAVASAIRLIGSHIPWKTAESALFGLTLLIILVVSVLLGSLPITARDALTHHLAVPRFWVESGFIHEIPWHEWSYYPMLIELAYTALLSLHLDQVTPFYHALYLPILGAIALLISNYFSQERSRALLSSVLIISLPLCLRLATMPMVDLPLAVFIGMGIYFLLLENYLIAGVSFGLGASVKYNGVLAVVVILAVALCTLKKWKGIIVAAILAGITFAPWALKNFEWTDNPVYPLAQSYFHSTALSPLSKGPSVKLSPLEYREAMYGEDIIDIALLPFRLFLEGKDDDPRKFDGILSPLLLLGIWPFLPFFQSKEKKMLYLISVIYLIAALLSGPTRARYLIPIFIPLSVLTSLIVPKKIIPIAFAFQLLLIGTYAAKLIKKADLVGFFQSSRDKEAYLARHIPEYAIIRYVNQNLDPSSKTLLVLTGNRFYYHTTPVLSGGHFSQEILLSWIRRSHNREELKHFFQEQEVSHFMTNVAALRESLATLTDDEKIVWNSFFSLNLKLLTKDGPFALWVIE